MVYKTRQLAQPGMLFLFACVTGGCSPAPAPSGPPSPSGTDHRDGPGADKKPQILALTAEEMTKEFDQDEAAAQKKYENQLVEVTGTVGRRGEANPKGTPPAKGGISLHGYKSAEEGILARTVLCLFEVDSPDNAAIPNINLDQKVKIRGSFDHAFKGFIRIEHCKLIEPSKPSPPP
jgi:hypothetical protein